MGDILRRNMDIVVGLIMLAILFILFPTLVVTGSDTIIDWTGTGGSTIGNFTGLEAIVSIGPMLVFVAVLFAGLGSVAVGGVRTVTEGHAGMGMLLGVIVIGICLTVYPIVLDGTNELLNSAGIASYTGLEALAKIAPLMVFVSMLFTGIALIGYGAYSGARGVFGVGGGGGQ